MKLYKILEDQLKKENNFISDDGELKKWVVLNRAQDFDERLIELLLENKELKEKFFVKIKEALVFNQNLFIQFLEQKNYLNDSYTQYKNKVGLSLGNKFLKQRNEVALVWPFKDCILEGGQSKEEDKKEEIFFNEILAQDEITQLLEPKVLTAAKTYDKNGEHDFNGFTRDAAINKKRNLPENTITDNLIIKGNNLLALHSLKKEFAQKIKLIYIDPPYNKSNDTFKYNDNFNHSSWLTFMKNRLEIAKTLLRDDGIMFVQCDDNEQAYLKVLMDEVFGKEKFIGNFMWMKTSTPPSLSKNIRKKLEYILCYKKESFEGLNGGMVEGGDMPLLNSGNYIDELVFPPNSIDFNIPDGNYTTGIKDRVELLEDVVVENGKNKNYLKIKAEFKWKQNTLNDEISKGTNFIIKSEKFAIRYIREGERIKKPSNLISKRECVVGTNEDAKKELQLLFNHNAFDYPKPESLLRYIINMATQPNDIVLDFHLGSGTTAAVAHKMGRQYIGIEQMDYIETVAVQRLKKVIEGEQGGISKSLNWQGGGAFTYLELKKYNQTFMEQIEDAKDSETLLAIWEQMKAKSFLNYNVDLKKQDAHIDEFKQLKLTDQKKHLAQLLDKNQLYVNLSSLNDADFECTDKEKQISLDFYKLKKD